MYAAVLHDNTDRHKLEELRRPSLGPHDVLVRTVATGVCHSDRAMQRGARALPRPLVLGHETAGIVQEVGDEVHDVVPGDPVVATAAPSCRSCRWCTVGQPQLCLEPLRASAALRTAPGMDIFPFARVGGFASHLLLHERAVVPVPAEMPLDRAALLGCAVLTGVGAVRHRAQVQPGETVAVLGCGGVGLSSIQGARLADAAAVIAIDRRPSALELATRLGATSVIDAGQQDPVAALLAEFGGVDHVIECVGGAGALRQAWDMLGPRGTVTAVGYAPNDIVEVPMSDLLDEKRLQGSKLGSTDPRTEIPLYCEWYLQGRLHLDEMVARTLALDEVDAALDDLDTGTLARSVIVFPALEEAR